MAVGRPFPKGISGNPGGRPKDQFGIRELAREACPEAIETLCAILRDTSAPHNARISAGIALLDRGYGKPTQPLAGEDGGAIPLEVIQRIIVDPEIRHQDSENIPAATH